MDVQIPRPITFGPDGRRLLTEWSQSWAEYSTMGDDGPRWFIPGYGEHETWITLGADRAAVSPDRTLIARCTAAKKNEQGFGIDLLDATTGESRGRIEPGQRAHRPAFAPDGRTLYAITLDGLVRGWDIRTGREVMRTDAPLSENNCSCKLLVSPTGTHLATVMKAFSDVGRKDAVRVINARTGEIVFTAAGSNLDPHGAFSMDGRWFAVVMPSEAPDSMGAEIRIWESATGNTKLSLPGAKGQPAFSPDGRSLAVNHEDAVVLFELATGRPRHEFRHHGTAEPGLVWQPDGRTIAAASSEAPIYLWDVVGDRTGNAPAWEQDREDELWSALGGSGAPEAFRAIRTLWAQPDRAIRFLKARVVADCDARLASRSCEILELIATSEARSLLSEWAASAPKGALAREAKDSLRRLLRT
jgi:WD40 repeat protein